MDKTLAQKGKWPHRARSRTATMTEHILVQPVDGTRRNPDHEGRERRAKVTKPFRAFRGFFVYFVIQTP